MEEQKIKVKYSKLEEQSTKELLKMKKSFLLHNMHRKNLNSSKEVGYSLKEVRKNIARINHILNNRSK